jgi:hypothetical protein
MERLWRLLRIALCVTLRYHGLFLIDLELCRGTQNNEKEYCEEGTGYKYKVKPSVIKVETQVSNDFCYNCPLQSLSFAIERYSYLYSVGIFIRINNTEETK